MNTFFMLLILILPPEIVIWIPRAIVFSALYCISKLQSEFQTHEDNPQSESLQKFCLPLILFGFMTTIFVFFFDEYVIPKADDLFFDTYSNAFPIKNRNAPTNKRVRTPTIIESFALYKSLDSKPLSEDEKFRFLTDFWRKTSIPFASLPLLLFSIPIGLRFPNQSIFASIKFSAAACLSFWFAIKTGGFLTGYGIFSPFLGGWFANFTFSLFGFINLQKAG